MEATLAPDIQEMARRQFETGHHPTTDDVLREALRLPRERDEDRLRRVEELRAEIAIGLADIERGDVAEWDVEEIKAEGRRRLAERANPK